MSKTQNTLYISVPSAKAFGLQDADGSYICKFKPVEKNADGGGYGTFVTDNPEVIEKMEASPAYKVKFYKVANGKIPSYNPFKNMETVRIEKDGRIYFAGHIAPGNQDMGSAIRYGELKGLIFKTNGELRRDADEELVKEYENLKIELGV